MQWKIVMATLLLLSATALHAGDGPIYRFQDAEGRWHFGNIGTPPPGAETLEIATDANIIDSTLPPVEAPPPLAAKPVKQKKPPRRQTEKRPETECDRWREQLARVRSRLRAGYKASQYNRLTEQERRYSDKVFKLCR